jgi:hypothetical protein
MVAAMNVHVLLETNMYTIFGQTVKLHIAIGKGERD